MINSTPPDRPVQLPLFPKPIDRVCSACKKAYPPTPEYFKVDQRLSTGLANICKPCASAYSRVYLALNKTSVRAYQKRWNKANRDKERQRSQRWRERHPGRALERSRIWRQRHPERKREQSRYYSRLRRARKLQSTGNYTEAQVQRLYTQQSGRCFHCGADISNRRYHEDHWIALTRGGTNSIENIRLLCPPCNLSKSARLPHEWCPEKYPPPV